MRRWRLMISPAAEKGSGITRVVVAVMVVVCAASGLTAALLMDAATALRGTEDAIRESGSPSGKSAVFADGEDVATDGNSA